MGKTRFMIFSIRNKKVTIPNLFIDGVKISRVRNINLLGIMIDDQLNWKIHTHLLSRKISKSVGIFNKLKNILPLNIRLIIFNALISSYVNYGILVWGYHCNRLSKLQKNVNKTFNKK